MLRTIYFRDPTDPKFQSGLLETNSDLEELIAKIKMILFTNRGEVLGFPDFGMDLEESLFDFDINEGLIRDRFYAQIAKFIPETQYKIDIEFERQMDEVESTLFIFITIDGQKVFGLVK